MSSGYIEPRVRCRCGAVASHKCMACGNGVDGPGGTCRAHPAADVEVIRCMKCEKPLCFWHYVLQPFTGTSPDGKREVVASRAASTSSPPPKSGAPAAHRPRA